MEVIQTAFKNQKVWTNSTQSLIKAIKKVRKEATKNLLLKSIIRMKSTINRDLTLTKEDLTLKRVGNTKIMARVKRNRIILSQEEDSEDMMKKMKRNTMKMMKRKLKRLVHQIHLRVVHLKINMRVTSLMMEEKTLRKLRHNWQKNASQKLSRQSFTHLKKSTTLSPTKLCILMTISLMKKTNTIVFS